MRYIKTFALSLIVFSAFVFAGCNDEIEHTGDGNAVINFEAASYDVNIIGTAGQVLSIPVILEEGTTPNTYPIKVKYEVVGLNGIDPYDYVMMTAEDSSTPGEYVLFIEWYDDIMGNIPIVDLVVLGTSDLTRPQQVVIRMLGAEGATIGEIGSTILNISR